jgi:hypothetical protein
MKEYQATRSIFEHLSGIFGQLIAPKFSDDVKHSAMKKQLEKSVNKIASEKTAKLFSGGADDLLQLNMAQYGFYDNSINTIISMQEIYHKHLEALEAQKAEFWSEWNRSRNHYTYDIAFRFAQYFHEKEGAIPTFGISNQGTHASTDFGRALEDVFKILGIKNNVRRPAEAAIEALKSLNMRANSE